MSSEHASIFYSFSLANFQNLLKLISDLFGYFEQTSKIFYFNRLVLHFFWNSKILLLHFTNLLSSCQLKIHFRNKECSLCLLTTLEILLKLRLFRFGCSSCNSPLPKIALSCLQTKSLRSFEYF